MTAVRPLDPTPRHVAAVKATLGEAFTDDPMLRWIFPDDDHRRQSTAAWLGVFADAYAAGGAIDVVGDTDATHEPITAGVALWRTSAARLPFAELPSAGGLLAALVGAERAGDLADGLRAFAEHKPQPPFHYLQFLAVHPQHQGRGWGRRLVEHGQRRAAAGGQGIYLESTNVRNVPFYRSLGFREFGQFSLQPAGPLAYRLWWSP